MTMRWENILKQFHSPIDLMRFKKIRLKKTLLPICAWLSLQTAPAQSVAQALDALNAANLATIPALNNTSQSLLDSVNFAPRLLFQAATLIETQSIVSSKRKSDNTLVNSFEKFQYVAKGVFTKENALQVKSYELTIGEDAKVCRINLYQDSAFAISSIFLRWRALKDGSQFIVKIWANNSVDEFNTRIDQDGSGCYEYARDRKSEVFLKWDKFGNLLKAQTD
jgi:hypothetical protein